MTTPSSVGPLLAHYPLADEAVSEAEVSLLRLPVVESLVAGHQEESNRPESGRPHFRDLTVVRLGTRSGASLVHGWGECAALATAGYWPETALGAFDLLGTIDGTLIGRTPLEILEAPPIDRWRFPMAAAALEMAVVDLVLRPAGVSLAATIGTEIGTVPAGSTVGLAPVEVVASRVLALHQQGFGRVKVKIEPGHDLEVIEAIGQRLDSALTSGQFSLQVDANGSYGDRDLAVLVGLAEAGVRVIEQPFAVDRWRPAERLCQALLTEGLSTLVLADEQASTVDRALEAVARGAAHGVVVKPGRLGGLAPTLQLLDEAAGRGVPVSIGGMLESGLGRHALAAVAAAAHQSTPTVTGDLSPARRWLADDPWPDVEVSSSAGTVHIVVPRHPGVAPLPDPDVLDRHTVDRTTIGSAGH
ncbi:MAG: hypothetical protein OER95_02695 [Acidimicrobiia bacterium]|nr:hypothetical protein [Acidimicrobiia bacterium]